jgi:hypothetical protein
MFIGPEVIQWTLRHPEAANDGDHGHGELQEGEEPAFIRREQLCRIASQNEVEEWATVFCVAVSPGRALCSTS